MSVSKFHVEQGSVYAPGWHVYEEVTEGHLRSLGCFEEKPDAEDFLTYLEAQAD